MTELERCELAKKNGFTYCKLTGNITGASGRVLNMKKNNGYIGCSIKKDKKIYQVLGHRLAWYLYYGKLPNKFIDHIDGCRTNNRIDNLRDVTSQQNHFNNTKAKGYRVEKTTGLFRAYIALNRKQINLGVYKTVEEARSAYLEAKKKYHVI